MARPKLLEDEDDGGSFFETRKAPITFGSGSTLLDCVNGGGWAVGGTVNTVGDKSSGKTQLATEAMANYHAAFPDAPKRYNDAESAYDTEYGRNLGCPESVEITRGCETVEDFEADFHAFAKPIPEGGKGLYILDSLDSLSDVAEMEREAGEASYGMAKAKKLSEFFRKTVSLTAKKQITLFVVSQIRTAVGVTYGRPTTRAGGRALDFYALQVVYLTHTKRLQKEKKGVKRVVGIEVLAKNEKNKIAAPFRECEYPIIFNFGIDDVSSMLMWLLETKRHKPVFSSEEKVKEVLGDVAGMTTETWQAWRERLRPHVIEVWADIEKSFAPTKRKYPAQ